MLTSGNNHTHTRLSPTRFPSSELLTQTRELGRKPLLTKMQVGLESLATSLWGASGRDHGNSSSSSNRNNNDNLQPLYFCCTGARDILSAPGTTYHTPQGWRRAKGHNNYNCELLSTSSVPGWDKRLANVCLFKPHMASQGTYYQWGTCFQNRDLRLTAEVKGQAQGHTAP